MQRNYEEKLLIFLLALTLDENSIDTFFLEKPRGMGGLPYVGPAAWGRLFCLENPHRIAGSVCSLFRKHLAFRLLKISVVNVKIYEVNLS